MSLLTSLRRRRLEPEAMDDPLLDPSTHTEALQGLRRINAVSGSAGLLWPALWSLARRRKGPPLSVLDIATGAGDLPLRLWKKAKRHNLPLTFSGCDISPTALEYAGRQAQRAKAEIRFFRLNPLVDPIPPGHDVITCSLFLHHLADDQTVHLLRAMAKAAGTMVLVNDLRRHPAGLMMACTVPCFLSRSAVVHADARRSVRAAYTLQELRALSRQAGLADASLTPCWPYRMLLIWRQPG